MHWVDALYQAYLAAILSGAAILGAASVVGDEAASAHAVADIRVDGAAWVGCLVAAVVGFGLRSGSRGGPLALERAEVRHVLLAPVDRIDALRQPLVRQLRFLVFVAAVVGATAGHLADRRLPGNGAAWAASGALTVVVAVLAGYGLACLAAGVRLRPWLAAIVALGITGWSVADALDAAPTAPATIAGRIALWPLEFDAAALAAVAFGGLAVLAGLRLVGSLSLEQLERRSRLVGQLRFAATMQDIRTVVVLRRQLAQERPRNRPWLRPPLPHRRWPVLTRDLRSLLRWPAGRAVRLLLLAAVAGLSARGAWEGTTPLLVVAGLALFLAGLDAAEPLGQELDHPTRRDSLPVGAGWVHVRHAPAVLAVTLVTAALAAVAAVLVDPVPGAAAVAASCVVPAGVGAAAAALVNLGMGAPDPVGGANSAWNLAPPEAAGMRVVFRAVWPPAFAVLGVLPVLVARTAFENGDDPVSVASGALLPTIAVFTLVCGWLRFRDDIRQWMAAQMAQQEQQRQAARRQAEAADDDG